MNSILLFVTVIILANLVIITILLLKTGKAMQKVEILCDTFERTLRNTLEDSTFKMDDLKEKIDKAEDHLRTINKNIYIIARQLIRQDDEQEIA